ncbi:2-keto-4-pentenoate hydratase/2-oxohepta-3-ene-1,7-dioic acid hydratase in catechol pathway [Chitinophaga niastensis]|uniref:2-keto-4-pentenoate hydratase/2-oxohepta-3-ene-1,7-dioic acid hydratase in catechol pathway n=1 Tax=Chitinophaga niastensis TaxID=536980 RepID=A0A2P8HM51_CHINA|nr:fumarylacetoacetate hydrolase family protein [Chitinophaga niastensis]PSL47290.1 2-keto-4-pentenoate hydratase/2-oxohepta-3-ene-1,7-dioic acid hydratase in catechol pathway [Chitinophaga niastensis]
MKIICVGRNYADHAKELKNEVPSEPVLFMKPKNALLQNSHPFYYPEFTKNLHYECELVLRVSKNGKHVQEKFADKYYDQISVGIDFTARDLQDQQKAKGLPWEIAKAFDNSAVVGNFIPITPEMDKKDINFCLYKNKVMAQSGNTKDLLFSFDYLVAYISRFFTLNIGDLIFTGTPAGVGPTEIGDAFEAFIENDSLLEFSVK